MDKQVEALAFTECCERIIKSVKTDEYAKAYAKMGITLFNLGAQQEALKAQAIYILGNITRWREPQSKTIRQILKNFCKE